MQSKRRIVTTICHSLFHPIVLQYKQSRIHSFIYILFHFLLDPDPGGSGSATLLNIHSHHHVRVKEGSVGRYFLFYLFIRINVLKFLS